MPRPSEYNHPAQNAGISEGNVQPGLVQNVCRQWVVHEDAVLASELQNSEFERKYNRNHNERRLARQDVPLARQVQNAAEDDARNVRQRYNQHKQNMVEDDAIIAEQLQSEEFIRKEQERVMTELKDEEIARRLQEKEKKRYDLRVKEKELRKQRKMLEAELKRESSNVLDNKVTPAVANMSIAAAAAAASSAGVASDGHSRGARGGSARGVSAHSSGASGGGARGAGIGATGGSDFAAEDSLDFLVPHYGDLPARTQTELQRLQDEELAQRLQLQEDQRCANVDKLKAIEHRDAELARIIQEQEHLKQQKRSHRQQRHRDQRQSSDPCHAVERQVGETRHSRSLPQPQEVAPPDNTRANHEVFHPFRTNASDNENNFGAAYQGSKFATRPLPDTPGSDPPCPCNMSLMRALDRNLEQESSNPRFENAPVSRQNRDSRRLPLVLSDDEDLLPPPLSQAPKPPAALPSQAPKPPAALSSQAPKPPAALPSQAPKPSAAANNNIFAEIDPTWRQGQVQSQSTRMAVDSSPSERPLPSGFLHGDDGYCDLEDIRALRSNQNAFTEEFDMVPGQRRQPFNRDCNRASERRANCKQQ